VIRLTKLDLATAFGAEFLIRGPKKDKMHRRALMATDNANATSDGQDVLRLSTDIVSSYLLNNSVNQTVLPDLIRSVHSSLAAVSRTTAQPAPVERRKPAVPIGRSIQQDYIICLEDGKRLKMLKRYLRSRFNISPDEYRRRWGLPPDYPMVAPAYATRRSEFAKQIGLGRGVRSSGARTTPPARDKQARRS
jgi:predicted transcriptional regulator